MTQSTSQERVAQAILRLSHDVDWQAFVSGLEVRYNASKEALVSCAAGESEIHKGEARALRSLLADIAGARKTLERIDADRRNPRPSGFDLP